MGIATSLYKPGAPLVCIGLLPSALAARTHGIDALTEAQLRSHRSTSNICGSLLEKSDFKGNVTFRIFSSMFQSTHVPNTSRNSEVERICWLKSMESKIPWNISKFYGIWFRIFLIEMIHSMESVAIPRNLTNPVHSVERKWGFHFMECRLIMRNESPNYRIKFTAVFLTANSISG